MAALGGGLYLLARRIVRWHIPAAVLAGLLVPAVVAHALDPGAHLGPVMQAFSGATMLFSNQGDARAPAFLGPLTLGDVAGYAAPALGDLDGDGDFDALVGSFGEGIFVAMNTGTATAPAFAPPAADAFGMLIPANQPQLSTPELGDLDADGDLDALVGTVSNQIFDVRNLGTPVNPTFGAALPAPLE